MTDDVSPGAEAEFSTRQFETDRLILIVGAGLPMLCRDMIHTGQCHCGALRLRFETSRPLAPRACQCGFCRRLGARTVSDPAGAAELEGLGGAIRYRFATRTTDYLICARCGIYVAAAAEIDGRCFATLNLNAFDDPRLDLAAEPVSYAGETADAKAERRRARWTPARLI